jgi:hypothetical protein
MSWEEPPTFKNPLVPEPTDEERIREVRNMVRDFLRKSKETNEYYRAHPELSPMPEMY